MNDFYKSIFILVLFLTGCNVMNYHAYDGLGNGYSSLQTTGNAFSVTYTGPNKVDFKRLHDWALLRSAELTLENGYSYFSIQEMKNNIKEVTAFVTQGHSSDIRAKTQLFILCYQQQQNNTDFNARAVVAEIRDKYQITG